MLFNKQEKKDRWHQTSGNDQSLTSLRHTESNRESEDLQSFFLPRIP